MSKAQSIENRSRGVLRERVEEPRRAGKTNEVSAGAGGCGDGTPRSYNNYTQEVTPQHYHHHHNTC